RGPQIIGELDGIHLLVLTLRALVLALELEKRNVLAVDFGRERRARETEIEIAEEDERDRDEAEYSRCRPTARRFTKVLQHAAPAQNGRTDLPPPKREIKLP